MLYTQFEARLLANLHPSQPVYVAYSGGMDSHVVLDLLARFSDRYPDRQYGAIHIHHGLSEHADRWLAHCAKVCDVMGIAFYRHRLSLPSQKRQSLEAQARAARYQALAHIVPQGAMVLLGQHQQDQMETLLLQLKRGSGPRGLGGMSELSERDGVIYLRPLLDTSRQQMYEYAQAHALSWVEDESNQDVRFDRNFLRHQIIPLLQQRWPGIHKAVTRSARLCQEQQQLLDQQSDSYLDRVIQSDDTLSLPALMGFSPLWRKQIIRFWLARRDAPMPPENVLTRLENELMAARHDATPCIAWGDWQFRRFDRRLYLLLATDSEPLTALSWRGESELRLSDGRRIYLQRGTDTDTAAKRDWMSIHVDEQPITIEFSGGSERFRPAGAPVSKSLKQWMRVWKVPPWQRARIPLVRANGRLVAVMGYAVADDCLAKEPDSTTLRVAIDGA